MENSNKIVRTICLFSDEPTGQDIKRIMEVSQKLEEKGFAVQTKRLCSPSLERLIEFEKIYKEKGLVLGFGSVQDNNQLVRLLESRDIFFNSDLTGKEITNKDVQMLFGLIGTKPDKTFNFTYVFNNQPSSPFLPAGTFEKNGFAIGLQSTDLSEDCITLLEWLDKMKEVWEEIYDLFKAEPDFLGIDSSIAPLFSGKSSLIAFIKKLGLDFSYSVTTDTYLTITDFIKKENPKPIGLCGIMFPCLEDFELSDEYEKGNFTIERNAYLSLHSGVGIDTYPIGIDEKPERVLVILKLLQKLSAKYHKPLSARFVSDGKAKIGQRSNFENQYLKDVKIRPL